MADVGRGPRLGGLPRSPERWPGSRIHAGATGDSRRTCGCEGHLLAAAARSFSAWMNKGTPRPPRTTRASCIATTSISRELLQPRVDQEALEAEDAGPVKRGELVQIARDHPAHEADIDVALSLGSPPLDLERVHVDRSPVSS